MHVQVKKRLGGCFIDVAFSSVDTGITALFGPSGVGKSSIINMVAGLLTPDSGTIRINDHLLYDSEKGINVPPEKRNVGYIFQEARLFPHMSVKANLLYSHRSRAADNPINFQQVTGLLGIGSLLARRPKNLSGGEKQRVAFGRAVLSNPDILLMDEPLASLDEGRKDDLLPFIRQLNAEFSLPILYVSHSRAELEALTPNIIHLGA